MTRTGCPLPPAGFGGGAVAGMELKNVPFPVRNRPFWAETGQGIGLPCPDSGS